MANPTWQPLSSVGINCDRKFIRLAAPMTTPNNKTILGGNNPPMVRLPMGAAGFCYAATVGVIHVGFTRDFEPRQLSDPTRYDFCVSFNFRDIPKLEMSTHA